MGEKDSAKWEDDSAHFFLFSHILTVILISLNCVFNNCVFYNKLACQAGDSGLISGLEGSLEKEKAIRSSIPAWEIPWIEESDGLPSMGSRRIDST